MGGNFPGGNSPSGKNFLTTIFLKKLSINLIRLQQKDICFKLIKCCAKFLSRNFLFAGNIFNSKHVKQWKF